MKVKSESEVAQSCPTLRSHGLQPTRFLHPWDFPGKSTGVGCHRLLLMVLYLPVIMLQNHRKMLVKASSRQDSKRPICGLEQLQKGRARLAEFLLTLVSRTNPKSWTCFQSHPEHRTLFHCPGSKGCSPSPKELMRTITWERPREGAKGDGRQKGSLDPDRSSLTVSHSCLETPQSKTTTLDGKPDVTFSSGLETLPK